jgi:PAS domain S-box-containing protein
MTSDLISYYDDRLVALSILLAVLGSYCTIEIAGRVMAARGRERASWLLGGATAMGIGTWAMHYTGMLAFRLPIPIAYDWPTALLSFVPSFLASALGLFVSSRSKLGASRFLAGGIFMGGGIVALHYLAMNSMRLAAECHYSPPLLISSGVLAVLMSLLSLWLMFHFRNDADGQKLPKLASAGMLGAAIVAMHYTGMAAAGFTPTNTLPDLSHAVGISSLDAAGIGIVCSMVLVVLLLTSLADRLQREKEILQKIFDHIPVMISFYDRNHTLSLVNREWEKVRGITLKEINERHLDPVVEGYPDLKERKRVREFIAAATGEWADFKTIVKGGRQLDTSWAVVKVSDGTAIGIGQDISASKQAAEQLAESHQQLQNILNSLFVFVGLLSIDGVVLEANRAPLEAAAITSEEVLGKFVWDTYWWSYSAAVQERLQATLRRAARGEVVRYDEVVRVAGDERITIDVVFGPLRDPEGEIVQIVGSAVDITERKRAEEALKATSEQLRALTASLRSAREEEGTRIARELHDELGSALTSLRWGLDEIDNSLSTSPITSDANTLREKIAAMTALVTETLSTVRRISGELRPGILDDVGLTAAIRWEGQQFQGRTGIACYFDFAVENVVLTREQSTAIFRIFQEALTNVLRHAKATRVDITMDEEAGALVLTISDNGRGITQEEQAGAKSLGLLGMRERAHLIEAEIDIGGAEGKGTMVKVRVPIRPGQGGLT